ncbi:hypothetical protein D9M72_517050 [compost metagenome]
MPMPMRTSWPEPKPKASSAFSRARVSRMPSAARSAFCGWLTTSTGAFQKAMMESPMNLSSVPSLASTWRLSASSSVLRKATTSVGVMRSLISVKLRTSTNITVSSRSSPPRLSALRVCSMR